MAKTRDCRDEIVWHEDGRCVAETDDAGYLTLPSGARVLVTDAGIDPAKYPKWVVEEFDRIDAVILPSGRVIS